MTQSFRNRETAVQFSLLLGWKHEVPQEHQVWDGDRGEFVDAMDFHCQGLAGCPAHLSWRLGVNGLWEHHANESSRLRPPRHVFMGLVPVAVEHPLIAHAPMIDETRVAVSAATHYFMAVHNLLHAFEEATWLLESEVHRDLDKYRKFVDLLGHCLSESEPAAADALLDPLNRKRM